MAITLTSSSEIELRSHLNLVKYSFEFEIDPVLGNGEDTGELILEVVSRGELKGFGVETVSNDYDISLRSREGVDSPNISEFYKVISINKVHIETLEFVYFVNSDDENKLYFILTNNSSIAIDSIELYLYVDKMS